MDTPRFRQLVELLGEAMGLPKSERNEFLVRACAGDAELLAEAQSLLAEAQNTSIEAVTARLGAGVGRAAASMAQTGGLAPSVIGSYRIVDVLGEGGMGVVYRAEQTSPVKREVALKVVRGGFVTPQARARFEAERQALAMMDHPHIARLYDAGATPDGAPYFAMELVHGEPITEFCDVRRLDLDARLALFEKVCRAVSHAHVKGVIHRDLKPYNILVSLVDDLAEPRVIDFGIAKAVEVTSEVGAKQTQVGTVMGTLEYMSPEQAAGGEALVDTRSDVYSLGVILYELVAGGLPFESAQLRKAGAVEAQRIIRDTDPPTPERRWSGASSREQIATQRGLSMRALQKRLSGDLSWIIMRALEKDPARRYQSANDLAADLDRLRRSQPVEAGPPSRRYRAAKFIRRHRTGVLAASLVFVALAVGVALATVGLVRTKRAQVRAENEARRATVINNFLTDMLAQARPEKSHGRAVTVQEVVDSMAEWVDRTEPFKDDPVVAASILHALGETYRSVGKLDRATGLFQRALALRRSALGPDDSLTLSTLNKLAATQAESGDERGAIETQKEVVALWERTSGKESMHYGSSLNNLANMYADVGNYDTAEIMLRQCVEIDRRAPGDSEELPTAINNLATVLVDEGKCDEATALHEESIALRRRFYGEPSAEVSTALSNWARALDCAKRYDEAESAAQSALAMAETVYGSSHVRTATCRLRLGEVMLHTGRAAGADSLFRSALTVFTGVGERFWRTGQARARLGQALLEQGHDTAGISEMETGWGILTETLRPDAPGPKETAGVIADYYDRKGPTEQAVVWRRRAEGGR